MQPVKEKIARTIQCSNLFLVMRHYIQYMRCSLSECFGLEQFKHSKETETEKVKRTKGEDFEGRAGYSKTS